MSHIKIFFAFLAVIALTLASGVIHGQMSYRWGKPVDMLAAATKLGKTPEKIGPWVAEESGKLDPETAKILESAGSIVRTYVSQDTGARVQVAVLLGPTGPTAVHTPDICYSSQDFRTLQELAPWEFTEGDRKNEFLGMTLEPIQLTSGGMLRTYHAWSTGKAWSAPLGDNRLAFAKARYLYKIQIACPLADLADAGTDKDPGRLFLRDFIPALKQFLIPPEN